jgi:hypothetical protein
MQRAWDDALLLALVAFAQIDQRYLRPTDQSNRFLGCNRPAALRDRLRLLLPISLPRAAAFASGYIRLPYPPGRAIPMRAAPTPTPFPGMRMRAASLRRGSGTHRARSWATVTRTATRPSSLGAGFT